MISYSLIGILLRLTGAWLLVVGLVIIVLEVRKP